jgi:hypothetical protein
MAVKQIPNLTPVVFLSPAAQLEIVQDGVSYRASAGQIGALGGFTVTNDVTSATPYFPIYLRQSEGTAEVVYASSPRYTYLPSEGRLSAERLAATQGIVYNSNAITQSYTFPAGNNGLSAGPVTVAVGAVITVPTGSTWKVI